MLRYMFNICHKVKCLVKTFPYSTCVQNKKYTSSLPGHAPTTPDPMSQTLMEVLTMIGLVPGLPSKDLDQNTGLSSESSVAASSLKINNLYAFFPTTLPPSLPPTTTDHRIRIKERRFGFQFVMHNPNRPEPAPKEFTVSKTFFNILAFVL